MQLKNISILIILTYSPLSWSMGLLDAFHLSLNNDPNFKVAIEEHKADKQYKNLGLSALLPHITYSYNAGHSNSNVSYKNSNSITENQQRTYKSSAHNITLQQPLFDYEAFSKYRKGVAQSLMADENFRAKSQNLFVRLVDAYVGALEADEEIATSDYLVNTYTEQLALNKHTFSEGSGTRTDILETQAKLSLSLAKKIEAENSKNESLDILRRLLGLNIEINDLNKLKKKFVILDKHNWVYEKLQIEAVANNPKIAALRKNVDISKYEIDRNKAGFLPKLSLYASKSISESASETTYNQSYDTNSYGIQINIPLYSGGETLAATRQSRHQMQAQIYKLDDEIAQTLSDLRKNYDSNNAAIQKIAAYSSAVNSARVLVDATRKSLNFGLRTNLDLLNSEQQLQNSIIELTKSKFGYIKSYINIKFILGSLKEEDLEEIDNYFEHIL